MNTSIYTSALERTRFSPQRGASMDAQHAFEPGRSELLPRSQTLIMHPIDQRSCMELGVCQSRKPACSGCTVHDYPAAKPLNFAPGVIERLRPRRSRRLKAAALQLANALLIITAAGVAWGYVAVKAGWL